MGKVPLWACVDASGCSGDVTKITTTGYFHETSVDCGLQIDGDVVMGPWEPSGDFFSLAWRMYLPDFTSGDGGFLSLFNEEGEEFLHLYLALGAIWMSFSGDNFVTPIVPPKSAAAVARSLHRYVLNVNRISGLVQLLIDDTEAATNAINTSFFTGVTKMVWHPDIEGIVISSIICDNESVQLRHPMTVQAKAIGSVNTTSLTDIADIQDNNDATGATFDSDTDEVLFECDGRTLPANAVASAFCFTARYQPGVYDTLKGTVKIANTEYTVDIVTGATSLTNIAGFAVNPATNAEWSTDDLATTEFGYRLTDPSASDSYWANTVLLMGFDGAVFPGSAIFVDESSHAHGSASDYNGAIAQTGTTLFGTSSLKFNNAITPAYIEYPANADWAFPGAFTIEFYVQFSSLPGAYGASQATFMSNYNGTSGWFIRYWEGSPGILDFWDGSGGHTADWAPNTAGPYLITIERDASNHLRMFIDGVNVYSNAASSGTFGDASLPLTIGKLAGSSTNYFMGIMDEIRITKGVARYGTDAGADAPYTMWPRS
jgi:hypothetical protein